MNNKIGQDWKLGPIRPLPNPGLGMGWTQPQNSEAFSLRLSGKAGFLEVNGITCQAFKIYSLKKELLPMIRTLDLMAEGSLWMGKASAGTHGGRSGVVSVLRSTWKYSGSNTTLVCNPRDAAMGFRSGLNLSPARWWRADISCVELIPVLAP